MRRVAFAIPGDLHSPTGGYGYDRRMIAELTRLGWQVDVVGLGEGFPRPSQAQKGFAIQRLRDVAPGCPILIDGLAFGALPEAAEGLRARHPLIALVHHPLAYETGLSSGEVELLRRSERAALQRSSHTVVTSAATLRLLLEDYGIAAKDISVAPPGTDRVVPVPRSENGIVRLLSVGAIMPRKGFDILIAALSGLAELPWRLTIAGDRTRSPETAAALEADIARWNLSERVSVAGRLSDERLAALYADSDVFVLASHFEGYGMAFAEALAHGLPIIGTTGGAIPDTVPETAGILVPPGDPAALAAAIRLLIEDAGKRRTLADGARAAAALLPTWEGSAERLSAVIEAAAA